MKIVRPLLKILAVFVLVFIVYALIYHYKVKSSPGLSFDRTFIASDKDISNTAGEGDSTVYSQTSGLSEANIDKFGFYIRIDRINLFKPVVKNVDPRYEDVYKESWKVGVSHGKFTSLPDQIGNVYLFAHAVSDALKLDQNNAWFTLLDQLTMDDEIIIYYEGEKYTYLVSKIYSVIPTATGIYTGVSPVPKVTLQTCGPPRGSIDSRYIVEALQVKAESF